MPGESGDPDRTIENALADAEWLVSPAIERLRIGLPICSGDKVWLSAFIGLLRARTRSMREVIIDAITTDFPLVDGSDANDLDALVVTPDGEDSLRVCVLSLMLTWGVADLAKPIEESDWRLQRVPPHRLVISREPVTHAIHADGIDCYILPLDHQTALFTHQVGRELGYPLTSSTINWLTTRFADEVFWHPAMPEPRIQQPVWAPGTTVTRVIPRLSSG